MELCVDSNDVTKMSNTHFSNVIAVYPAEALVLYI